jgi:hypothetical protein
MKPYPDDDLGYIIVGVAIFMIMILFFGGYIG